MFARHKLPGSMPPQSATRPTPCLLAIDTSTERMALGVCAPSGAHTAGGAGGAQASAALLPALRALLAQAGAAWADIDAVAFGRGPGAFTGLRTACAVAQGIGFALGRPVLPIDSLLIVAEDARAQTGGAAGAGWTVGVAMDARMGEVYAGVYRHAAGGWHVLQEPALLALPALATAWSGVALDAVAGSALTAFGERLELPPVRRHVATEADRAGALLRLAVQAADAGAGVDAADALPLYLRDKVALTTDERAAARAAAAAAVGAPDVP